MGLVEIFSILIIHWFSDFVLQTDKQAKGKSTSMKMLISHTMNYTMVWWIIGIILVVYNIYFPFFVYTLWSLTLFVVITFVCHTITDYFTSRLNSKLWKSGNTHGFFISVGFDQVLHYVQLFLTFYLLTK